MSQLKFHNENLGNIPYTELYLNQSQKGKDKCLLKYLGTRDTPCELRILYQNSSFSFFSLGDEILQEHVNSLILH